MSEKNISENITKINANSPALDIPTPNLDELEKGPWPSYVSGLATSPEPINKQLRI
jgi:hypothetical protein